MGVDDVDNIEALLQQCNIGALDDFPGVTSPHVISPGEVIIRFATYHGDFFVYCFSEGMVDEDKELPGVVDERSYLTPTTDLTGVVRNYEGALKKCGVKFMENPSELAIGNECLVGIRLTNNEDDPTFRRILNVADRIARYACRSLEESALEVYS